MVFQSFGEGNVLYIQSSHAYNDVPSRKCALGIALENDSLLNCESAHFTSPSIASCREMCICQYAGPGTLISPFAKARDETAKDVYRSAWRTRGLLSDLVMDKFQMCVDSFCLPW